jgi:hypothetical protein
VENMTSTSVCKPYNVGHEYELRDATVTDADDQIQRPRGPDASFLEHTLRPTISYGHEASKWDNLSDLCMLARTFCICD